MAVEECRDSCRRARVDVGIEISSSAIDTFLDSLTESTFNRLKSSHGVSFPLAFPSLTSEINFLSILALLNAFSGYRSLFHAQTGEGAYQNVVRLLMGLYLSDGDSLSTKGLLGIDANMVAGIWNVQLMREIPHESIPGLSIMENGGEMSEVVNLVVGVCNETGGVLRGLGCGSLGEWVLGLLRRMQPVVEASDDLAAADIFVDELSSTFPAFRDISTPTSTHPYPISIHKRAFFLLLSLHQRLPCRRSDASSFDRGSGDHITDTDRDTDAPRTPDPKVLPMFVDNVLPTMSVHHGMLDLRECKAPAIKKWGENAEEARISAKSLSTTASTSVSSGKKDTSKPADSGPELSKEDAYIIRAATLDLGREIVERAHELGRTKVKMKWMLDMTELDLDGYLWSVAKDDPVLRKVPRMVEKRTVMY